MWRTLRVCVVLVLEIFISVKGTTSDSKFYLFGGENQNYYVQINRENAKDLINENTHVKFLIHGWSENRTTKWYEGLTNALLARDNCVVIQVDYSKVSSQPYTVAVRNSVRIGEEIGSFIVFLTTRGIPLENVQLIGHSLGGQVAGYAGEYIFQKTSKKLPMITALDPAGPFFQGFVNLNGKSLDRNDAEIVYVVHTDRNLFGQRSACGTVDVFPNGGSGIQPGCPEENDNLFCSHHRSYWYFISAVENPNSLVAVKCGSYGDFLEGKCWNEQTIDIGGEITREDKGWYYLRVSAEKPYRTL